MKSYTDIEQSKKLAEILPLESADMKILPFTEREYRIVPINDISVCGREDEIYAWSLTALLDVLPEINGTPFRIEKIKAEDGYNGYYYHIEYEGIILIPYSKNPIDACYEMIIKLYEQKLL